MIGTISDQAQKRCKGLKLLPFAVSFKLSDIGWGEASVFGALLSWCCLALIDLWYLTLLPDPEVTKGSDQQDGRFLAITRHKVADCFLVRNATEAALGQRLL
jgi:hypothetical protein